MRLTSLARRTAAVTAAAALISSGGAVLAAPAFAAPATVDHTSPTQADNRSSNVVVTAYGPTTPTPGNFLPGDVLVLHPQSVLPWVTAGGTDAVHEVKDITSGSSTIATDGSSESASFNLVMAPPGRYQVLVKHSDNSLSTPNANTVLTIFDYGAANVTSVGAGRDSTGSSCSFPPGACDRGDNALDISGSNFARGADVQFLKADLSAELATGLKFVPGNVGNTNGTGYPTTTLIQGNYFAYEDPNGQPLFAPGKHTLRVVNTYPSTSVTGAKTNGTTVEFWQPWFSTGDVTTNAGTGTAAVIGAGAKGVLLRIKGRGIRPGSSLSVEGFSYPLGTSCGDITVGSTSVTALTPTATDPSDSLLTASISAASCTDTSAARGLTIVGPEGATWHRNGVLTVKAAPKVDAKSFATLGQGANHYPGANPFEFQITGTGFDSAVTPSATVCPRFDFGAGTTTTTVTCGGSTSATVRVDVDPGATIGTYGVTVTNPSDGGSSTTAASSTAAPPYAPLTVAVGPSVTSVTPTSFTPGDTKTVTVTGKDFKSGLTVSARQADPVTGDLSQPYPGVTVGTVTLTQTGQSKVPQTTEATASFTVTVAANAPIGQVTLVLGNTDNGTVICTCVGVDSLSVNPASDGNTGSSVLGFTGIPLNGGTAHLGDLVGAHTSVMLTRSVPTDPASAQPPIAGTVPTRTGTDTASATFDLTDAAPGQYGVTWVADTTANPQVVWTCSACFTVNGNAISGVTIAPSSAGVGATNLPVKITGQNFSHGMTVAIDGNVQVGNVTYHAAVGTTPSYLTADVTVPSEVAPGQYDVTVAPADGKSPAVLTKGFTVNPPPTVSTVAPASYGQGATTKADGSPLTISVTGNDFATGSTLSMGDPKIVIGAATVTDDPSNLPTCSVSWSNSSCHKILTAPIHVGQDATVGKYPVTVSNTDGGQGVLADGFTVNPGPKILSLADEKGTPALRPDGQQHTITIVGSGFSTDAANKPIVAVTPADKITLGAVTVVSASQLTIPVTVATDAVRGARSVSVTNPADRGYGECAATPTACAYVAVEPDAPASLTLTSGARSLIASWPAPVSDGGAPITSYQLAYAPKGSTSTSVVDVPASSRTYTIGGLTNGVTYVVSVAAVNGVGSSASKSNVGVAGIAASVSLTGSATKVVWGSKLYFLGTLRGVAGAPLPSRSVVLYFFPSAGSLKYYTRTLTTNSKGQFGYVMDWRYDSPYNGKTRAYFLGDSTTYRLSNSAYVGYGVSPRVLKTSPANFSKSRAGSLLTIAGNVAPNKRGAPIYLGRIVNGRVSWVAKTNVVTSASTYYFKINPGRGTYTYFVYIAGSSWNLPGYSAKFTLYRV